MNIPSFEELNDLADSLYEAQKKKLQLEVAIKYEESQTFIKVLEDPKYWKGDKQPGVNFVEATYKYTGIDGSLIAKRVELAQLTAEVEKLRIKWDIYKAQIDLYRTESANQRSMGI